MVESRQGLRNIYIYIYIYILNVTCHLSAKCFQMSNKKHPTNHILVSRHAKHYAPVFSDDKGC